MECPGIGNYKRYRIFGGISHTSNVVAPQTLEFLEGWKFWRWEISEVPLYIEFIQEWHFLLSYGCGKHWPGVAGINFGDTHWIV